MTNFKQHSKEVKNPNTTLSISFDYDTEKLNKIIKIFEKENQDAFYEIKKLIPQIFDKFLELEKHELNVEQLDL